jgi:hypothetical protein
MRVVHGILIAILVSGCASQPKSPQENADALAAMGMMLMAGAAQQKGSAASSLWQVKIPPGALEVIVAVQHHRTSIGKWPSKEEIRLPAGITDVLLTPVEADLDLALKTETGALVCRLSPDGAVALTPPFEKLVDALRAIGVR